MSLMLDTWPADEAPQPLRARRPRHVWPWPTGVAVAVAIWVVLLGWNPFQDIDALVLVAVPSALALVGVGLLARTTLPGWAIVLAHFVVLPLALLTPSGSSRSWSQPASPMRRRSPASSTPSAASGLRQHSSSAA